MGLDFETTYARYHDVIAIAALGQNVPGLDYDDVVSEMTICLWRATGTYQAGETPFGSYWWSVWLNRRSDLAGTHFAGKRVRAVPVAEPRDTSYTVDLPPEPPPGSTRTERLIWLLLSHGEPVKDVLDLAEVSRRGYYDVIHGWRTEEIWQDLLG